MKSFSQKGIAIYICMTTLLKPFWLSPTPLLGSSVYELLIVICGSRIHIHLHTTAVFCAKQSDPSA